VPKYRVTLHDVFRVAFAADVDVEADTREEAEKKALDMAHRGKVEFGAVDEDIRSVGFRDCNEAESRVSRS
jgi:hypothetical protein